MFVEQHDGISGLQLLENQFTLGLFLLLLREILGVFEFGYGDDVEGHIVIDTLYVVVDTGNEVLIDGLANLNQNSFQLSIINCQLSCRVESFKVLVAARHHPTVDVAHPVLLGQCESQSDDDKHDISRIAVEDGFKRHDQYDGNEHSNH